MNRNHGHYRLLQQIGKAKISPTPREFLAHTDFLHTSIRVLRGALAMPTRGSSIPCPRAPSAASGPMRRAARERDRRNSLRRNFRIENAARKSADNIRTTRQLQGAWPWASLFHRGPIEPRGNRAGARGGSKKCR